MAAGCLDLPAAAADAKTAVGPAHILHRFRQPVAQAVARRSDLLSRWLPHRRPPSPRSAAGSHVAGAVNQVRSPGSNPREGLYPSPADRYGAFGFCVGARSSHAQHLPRPPESESSTLVIRQQLKARAHSDMFGTRVCSEASAWLGVRVWAGGRAHVAAAEGSRVAVYYSAVCMGIIFCNVGSPRARAQIPIGPQWQDR